MAGINAKSTKAEILAAFQALKKEKATLESQVKQKDNQSVVQQSPIMSNKGKEKKTMNATPTTPSQYNMNQIIASLQNLQLGFGSATSNLSEQLITEATSLSQLQELVGEELEQLQALHDLESVVEDTLENLIQSYETESKAFAQQFEERTETLSQEILDLKQGWSKEQENHKREIKDQNEHYQKTQERSGEEYKYNLELERDLSEEEYEESKKNLYRELTESRQEQEKQWQEREESIAEREKQYGSAKEKVEVFEKKLKDKIKEGKDKGRSIGYYQVKVKSDLRQKEIEGARSNYELQIESLHKTIRNQEERIQTLSKQLDGTQKQVQDLAVKAIEGTSNRNSYQAMKDIAMEQAKNQQKGK